MQVTLPDAPRVLRFVGATFVSSWGNPPNDQGLVLIPEGYERARSLLEIDDFEEVTDQPIEMPPSEDLLAAAGGAPDSGDGDGDAPPVDPTTIDNTNPPDPTAPGDPTVQPDKTGG